MCISCGCGRRGGAGHFPVILLALTVVTFFLTYGLAVYRGDVIPLFPYISDAGARRPESCVFGQLLNFSAFLGLLVIYLRYRLVRELNRGSDLALSRLNFLALLVGVLSSLGMSVVGNFQILSVMTVHFIGAFTCFIAGLLYCWFNVAVSLRMYPLFNGIRICRIRLLLATVSTLAFITCLSAGFTASIMYRKVYPDAPTPIEWKSKTDPGFQYHVVSAVAEWVLSFSITSFLVSYVCDFEKLRVFVAVEPLVNHLDEAVAPAPPIENSRLIGI